MTPFRDGDQNFLGPSQKFGDDPQTEKPETVRKTQKTRFLAVFATLTKNVPQRHEKAKNAKNAFFDRFRGTPPAEGKKTQFMCPPYQRLIKTG